MTAPPAADSAASSNDTPERTAPGPDDAPPEGLRLGVAELARRMGVGPSTLRTWERRYGVGPSAHAPGSHRRYAPLDVRRLELMQHALLQGASPAEAARVALAGADQLDYALPEYAAASLWATTGSTPGQTLGRRSPLRLSTANPRAIALARAVLALNMDATLNVLHDSVRASGVVATWDDVARPVLRAQADLWVRTGDGVEVEHLLTEALTTILARASAAAPPPQSVRPVVLGALAGEHHALPMRVLTAALVERRVRATMMGTDLPVEALSSTITRTAPAAVFLWSQVERSADVELVGRLPRRRPPTRCYVGGPGWASVPVPAAVVFLGSLGEASNVLTAASGL